MSSNLFDILFALTFFAMLVGALLFANPTPPARQKQLLQALGLGGFLMLLTLLGLLLALPFQLFLSSAIKVIVASLFIVGGHFVDKVFTRLFTRFGLTPSSGMYLRLSMAAIMMLLNLTQP